MNVVLGKEILRNAQTHSVGPYPGQSGLHGLLHNLTDLAGHGESAFAFHLVGLDEEHIASGRSPSQTHGHARTLCALRDLALRPYFDSSEKFVNHIRGHNQFFALAFRQPARLLPADRTNVALQVAHARFARVMANQGLDSLLRELDLLGRNAVLFDLSRNKILES